MRSLLAQRSGGKVGGDAGRWPGLVRGQQRGPGALLGLLNRSCRQSHDREAGDALSDVDLDLHEPGLRPDNRYRLRCCDHEPSGSGPESAVGNRLQRGCDSLRGAQSGTPDEPRGRPPRASEWWWTRTVDLHPKIGGETRTVDSCHAALNSEGARKMRDLEPPVRHCHRDHVEAELAPGPMVLRQPRPG